MIILSWIAETAADTHIYSFKWPFLNLLLLSVIMATGPYCRTILGRVASL